MPDTNTDYINSVDYTKLEKKFKDMVHAMGDIAEKNKIARDLRYVEVDIEGERARGKLQPDELLIPQHLIDTNIRREQPAYVQFVSQSPRAVVLTCIEEPTFDATELEKDVSNRLRFPGWQLSMFSCIDGMQQNGYGIMELVLDQSQPGELAHEFVPYGDFGFPADTKDIQEAEMVCRNYYFSRTRLLEMTDPKTWGFDAEQVKKVIDQSPPSDDGIISDNKDKSLFKIQKLMFRVGGVVQVAWACDKSTDGWLRAPRPLYIGRRQPKQAPSMVDLLKAKLKGKMPDEPVFETRYPYFMYPYLISEDSTVGHLKGRAFLDQDCQQAVISLISSYVTAHRRASGLYFSKTTEDPNDDWLLKKNIFFKSGALINSKVTQFQLTPPSADVLTAVNVLITGNSQETSQVNFAANNRKDSRKTAKEISTSENQEAKLTTVQVVLFSLATKSLYETMFNIIQSRVVSGLLIVPANIQQAYQKKFIVKPAGDTDVIERQQLIQAMMMAWPIISQTPLAMPFFIDMIGKMFPEQAARYTQVIQQALQQQQSQQQQTQAMFMQKVKEMADGIVSLSKKPEMFSDIGRIHALPAIEMGAEQIEQAMKQFGVKQ